MTATQTTFDQLRQALANQGIDATLNRLVDELRTSRRYHELFEALKMRVRRKLGLPLLYNDLGDELDEPTRTGLEDGLLDACREVGAMLLDDGRIREGWMYLRPVGDRQAVASAMAEIEPDEDNVDELVEVALNEGVDPARGYALVLEHFGTCNAITTFETTIRQHRMADQQAAAGLLVEHVHRELLATVRADIAQQEGTEPAEASLAELVAERDWLFGEHSYHIDTTHLASTVRFARILEDPEQLRLALDLTAYGCKLSPQFQYQGEEPFVDIYPTHALYLGALVGKESDAAVSYFRERAQQLEPAEHGSQPLETLVQLLMRLERHRDAMDVLLEYAAADESAASRIVPTLLELAGQCGDFGPVQDFCRNREDLLGFTSALIESQGQSK